MRDNGQALEALTREVLELRVEMITARSAIIRLASIVKLLARETGREELWIEALLGSPIAIEPIMLRAYPWLAGGDRDL